MQLVPHKLQKKYAEVEKLMTDTTRNWDTYKDFQAAITPPSVPVFRKLLLSLL